VGGGGGGGGGVAEMSLLVALFLYYDRAFARLRPSKLAHNGNTPTALIRDMRVSNVGHDTD